MSNPAEFSVVRTTVLDEQLRAHLVRDDGQEELAFVTWHPSSGSRRTTAVLTEAVMPERGDRQVHGTASFNTQYFIRAAELAAASGAGLALIHSHPASVGWQSMSSADRQAEQGHAAQAKAITGLPLVGMTLDGNRTISARLWSRISRSDYRPRSAVNTRTAGRRFRVTFNPKLRAVPDLDVTHPRTISAWGSELQDDLARLRVGIIGLGSVGMLIAEALVRSGVGELLLMDFDTIKPHNLDRTIHATWLDVVLCRAKVEVALRALQRSRPSTHTSIEAAESSIIEEDGLRRALDCDMLFCCVDRPWPRAILNRVAYHHVIPVVDGGILVPPRGPTWMGPVAISSYVAAPGRRCMACMRQYTPSAVAMEQDGSLDEPTYVAGLDEEDVLRTRQNVFAFAEQNAALELMQFVAMFAGPAPVLGPQRFSLSTGEVSIGEPECDSHCEYPAMVALGDSVAMPTREIHSLAISERERRSNAPWRVRAGRHLDRLLAAPLERLRRRVH